MYKLEIISKNACAPCYALKKFINQLPERYKENITLFQEGEYHIDELNRMVKSVHQYSYPTIILKEDDETVKVVTGFGYKTGGIIVQHLNKNYVTD